MKLQTSNARLLLSVFLLASMYSGFGSAAYAQVIPPFDSGSDGSDGPLDLTTAGTYFFDPSDTALFGKVLDPDGDGIFHFTTINIASGVTLRFRGDRYNRPVVFLASGAATIDGTLDLKGDNEAEFSPQTDLDARRHVTIPGSGGFSGGAPGWGATLPATAGDGPGGGPGGVPCGINAAFCDGVGATFGGTNRYLVPLLGGSGGGGGWTNSSTRMFRGGAGGGAILIASSNGITVAGIIDVRGGQACGNCSVAGAGSGGAIRLVAPTISTNGTGKLLANGGGSGASISTHGRVRLEAFQFLIGGAPPAVPSTMVNPPAAASSGFPVGVFPLASAIRIVSIDGQVVGNSPSGSFFKAPDVTVNKATPIPVVVHAMGIPPNTPIQVKVFSDNPSDPLTVISTYNGTLDDSLQASVNVPFPYGLSRCYIQVTWVQ